MHRSVLSTIPVTTALKMLPLLSIQSWDLLMPTQCLQLSPPPRPRPLHLAKTALREPVRWKCKDTSKSEDM